MEYYTTEKAFEAILLVQQFFFATDGDMLDHDVKQEQESRTAITIYNRNVSLHYKMDHLLLRRAKKANCDIEVKSSGMIYVSVPLEFADGTEEVIEVCLS